MGRGRKPDEWYKSEECKRVVELAKEGYSEGRIAEIVGIKKSRVMYAKRLFGLKGARKFTTSGITYNDSLLAKHEHSNLGNERRKQESESQLAFLLLDKGFLYIGGYDGKNSTIEIGCTVCGGTFTRYCDVNFKRKDAIECPICKERALEPKRQAERERHQEYIKLQAEWERRRTQRQEQKKENKEKIRTCKECGKKFTLKDYATRENIDITYVTESVYCSSECRTNACKKALRELSKEHRHERDHKKRAIKYGCDYEKGITLKSLIKRDGLRCAICGGMCDLKDRSYGNGNGPLYPSIDHIKPMSKQGGHTWDNVQIAHIICNIRKNAKIDEKYGNVS